jgi:putative NADPH-quinone reductase
MPRRVAVIQGHPDPGPPRLCHALADAYAAGAAEAGHQVARIELARLDFPMLRSQQEFEHGELPPVLIPARDAIVAAEHLVIVFPLWLGTMPALVKAFLEQVMRPGIAFEYRQEGFPRQLLTGRSARLVVTMGMPALVYRWYFHAHGLRGLEQGVLRFAGMKPVRQSLFGMVEAASPARRRGWLDKMRRYGTRLA